MIRKGRSDMIDMNEIAHSVGFDMQYFANACSTALVSVQYVNVTSQNLHVSVT